MKTGNVMQLKARINNKSKELSVPPQIMLQNYLMECFLERLGKSEYADRFIWKRFLSGISRQPARVIFTMYMF